MEPYILPERRSRGSRRWVLAALLAAAALLLVPVAWMLKGSITGHDRPIGHIDISFAIAPDGGTLAFNAVGEGGRDLYLLDLATLRVTRVAATPEYEVDPEFSPDGKSVVYAAGKPGDRADHIFLRSLAGKTVKQLTTGDANDASPAFSPDGSLIAFTRDKTYNWGGLASNWDEGGVLCVMKADGTGLRQLTRDGSMAIDPHFSPDGRTIVFRGGDGLLTVAADGAEPPRPLGGLKGWHASYAPDGGSIVFAQGRYSPEQSLFVARADGTELRMLAHPELRGRPSDDGGCTKPAFTPDGGRILFFVESWPSGPTGVPKQSLWEISLAGGRSREIADFGLFDDPLHWRPRAPIPAKSP